MTEKLIKSELEELLKELRQLHDTPVHENTLAQIGREGGLMAAINRLETLILFL